MQGSTDVADANTSMSIIAMSNVTYAWPGKMDFCLRIRRFTVQPAARLLLTGPSGSGKTTLLNLVCGIATPNSGSIRILDRQLATLADGARDRFRAEHIGVIFQMFNLLPYGSVIDNVTLPLSFAPRRRGRAARNGHVDHEARRLLGALGLDPKCYEMPTVTLSIGQQQRVAAARALIGAPEIIIADEPTSALDRDNQDRFLDLLFDQVEAVGATLIMVSHDASLGARFQQVVALEDIIGRGDASCSS